MGKFLIIAEVVLIGVGIWLVGERFGLGRLPGDVVIERENTRVYVPVMTSIIIGIILSLALWLFNR